MDYWRSLFEHLRRLSLCYAHTTHSSLHLISHPAETCFCREGANTCCSILSQCQTCLINNMYVLQTALNHTRGMKRAKSALDDAAESTVIPMTYLLSCCNTARVCCFMKQLQVDCPRTDTYNKLKRQRWFTSTYLFQASIFVLLGTNVGVIIRVLQYVCVYCIDMGAL